MHYCRHLPEHVEHYGLSYKSYPLGSHFKGQTFFWNGEAAASEILRCLQNLSLSPFTSFMFASFDISSSPFPPRPLLPIICQKLCRSLSLKTRCSQNLRIACLRPPRSPLCTFLLSCLKTDDLNLIWRCNAFRQCYTHSCVFVFLHHH